MRRLALSVLLFAVNAQAILIDRGNGLIFDDVNNISWTQIAGDGVTRNWAGQLNWANGFTLAGFDDFRLASIVELTSLYGQLPGGPNKTGDIAPFEDIQSVYWSGTEFTAGLAWAFLFNDGAQGGKANSNYVWAVRVGDSLAAVPEPASILLLGAGLSSLLAVRRRLRK